MGEGLKALAPDVLCLQEAFYCPDAGADTAAYLADLLGLRKEVLTARCKTRTFEEGTPMSCSNLAILTKVEVERSENVKLVAHEADPDRWAMRVKLHLNGVTLSVINTHLTHVKGQTGRMVRSAQAGQIAELCRDALSDAVVLCGDLNATWESDELYSLRELNWQIADVETPGGTWLGAPTKAGGEQQRRIDNIQVWAPRHPSVRVKRRFPAMKSSVGPAGEYPSDHAALVTDVALDPLQSGTV